MVKEGILNSLDFIDFGTYVDCIKGKFTKTSKKGARSTELLEIIHIDICGKMPYPSISGDKHFITFITDMGMYLLKEKSEATDVFEIYKKEEEK